MRSRDAVGFAAALFGLVAVTASCRLVQSLLPAGGPAPRPFDHAAHLDRGVDCMACHETAEKEARAGMPSRDACMTCHDEIDKDPKRPREKTVAWFLDDSGLPRWSAFTSQSPEIRFDHRAHAAKKIACSACHAGIEKDTGLRPGMVQRMDSCVACHAATAPARNECSTCHREIDRDRPPANHARLWTALHGRCSRDGPAASTANDCALCHRRDECVTCHQTRPPADHNEFWRLRGHGVAADIDRMRCVTCHQSDSCERCHRETSPASHVAGWSAPTDRHCFGCHVPLQTSGSCFVCHKSTPGHEAAPPKPAWHTASMNCRACHAASLTHPDNGDSCNACHR